jgi:hypothetical protein
LNAVLASDAFARAPGLTLFLRYVCERYFEGESDKIKEYNIAVEAFHRSADFDQTKDSIVRVEAHRVRKRLKRYYETEGIDSQFRIVLPSGTYVPEFVLVAPGDNGVEAESTPLGTAPASTNTRRPVFVLWSVAAFLALGVVGWLILSKFASPVAPASATSVAGTTDEIRIAAGNSGAPYVDALGHAWGPDRYFSGGSPFRVSNVIAGTLDQPLFQTGRQGECRYDIPLPQNDYEMQLYFAETSFGLENAGAGGESSRLMDVMVNGSALLSSFDVISDTGSSNRADIRVFRNIRPAPDGFLHLYLTRHGKGPAFINAIELIPSVPHKVRPVRIVTRESAFIDNSGVTWFPDRFFVGGQSVARQNKMSGDAENGLYRSERFGRFTYVIPVAPGRYSVTLYFAETWFGAANPGRGGIGSRVFDVYGNHQALLRRFDILQEAGGPNRGISKRFNGLEANSQGKLELEFMPIRNYACVNAIEVTQSGE